MQPNVIFQSLVQTANHKLTIEHYRLPLLDYDALRCVIDTIEAASFSLVPLSSTCRQLRDICRPLIFRQLTWRLDEKVTDSELLCPPTVSSLVQYAHSYQIGIPNNDISSNRLLTLVDCCRQQEEGLSALFSQQRQLQEDDSARLSEDPFLCRCLDRTEVLRALHQMTALRHITLASSKSKVLHGVRWHTLKAILSLPRLEEFSLHGLLFSPLLPVSVSVDELECPTLQHIKSFKYEVPSFRVSSWGTRERYPFQSEEEILWRVLHRLCPTVETLVLSSEPAPIRTMTQWEWPKLRELRLTGEHWTEPLTPIVLLLATMPHLLRLSLELTLVRGQLSQAPPLWPRGYNGVFPWPDLTHLLLSHPHPEDELFAHLPPALRSLSLCSLPHKSEKLLLDGSSSVHHRYKYVVLDSSEMRNILQRCRLPQLTHLELEYNAGERENDLLEYLAVAFPLLTSLKVHRYRAMNSLQAPMAVSVDVVLSISLIVHLRPITLQATAGDRIYDHVKFQVVVCHASHCSLPLYRAHISRHILRMNSATPCRRSPISADSARTLTSKTRPGPD